MTSSTHPSTHRREPGKHRRHRAAPTPLPRAALGGLPGVLVGFAHRRAAIAGVTLATAATVAAGGVLTPALQGDGSPETRRATDAETPQVLSPARTLELVSQRTSAPSPKPGESAAGRTTGRTTAGHPAARTGAAAADDALAEQDAAVGSGVAGTAAGSNADGTPATPSTPGGADAPPPSGSPSPGGGSTPGTGGGQSPADGSGDSDGSGDPGGSTVRTVVETVDEASESVRDPRLSPVGDAFDDTARVVEQTVAGPLASVVP